MINGKDKIRKQEISDKNKKINKLEKENEIKNIENLNQNLINKEKELENQKQLKEEIEQLKEIQKEKENINKKKIIQDIKAQNEKLIEKKGENNNIQQQKIQKENQYKKEFDNLNKNNIIIKNVENEPPFYPILSKFKKTPQIGLANIGSANYMNAVLQCFSQAAPLTEYFLNPKHKEIIIKRRFHDNCENEPKLSEAYYEILQKL